MVKELFLAYDDSFRHYEAVHTPLQMWVLEKLPWWIHEDPHSFHFQQDEFFPQT